MDRAASRILGGGVVFDTRGGNPILAGAGARLRARVRPDANDPEALPEREHPADPGRPHDMAADVLRRLLAIGEPKPTP